MKRLLKLFLIIGTPLIVFAQKDSLGKKIINPPKLALKMENNSTIILEETYKFYQRALFILSVPNEVLKGINKKEEEQLFVNQIKEKAYFLEELTFFATKIDTTQGYCSECKDIIDVLIEVFSIVDHSSAMVESKVKVSKKFKRRIDKKVEEWESFYEIHQQVHKPNKAKVESEPTIDKDDIKKIGSFEKSRTNKESEDKFKKRIEAILEAKSKFNNNISVNLNGRYVQDIAKRLRKDIVPYLVVEGAYEIEDDRLCSILYLGEDLMLLTSGFKFKIKPILWDYGMFNFLRKPITFNFRVLFYITDEQGRFLHSDKDVSTDIMYNLWAETLDEMELSIMHDESKISKDAYFNSNHEIVMCSYVYVLNGFGQPDFFLPDEDLPEYFLEAINKWVDLIKEKI